MKKVTAIILTGILTLGDQDIRQDTPAFWIGGLQNPCC